MTSTVRAESGASNPQLDRLREQIRSTEATHDPVVLAARATSAHRFNDAVSHATEALEGEEDDGRRALALLNLAIARLHLGDLQGCLDATRRGRTYAERLWPQDPLLTAELEGQAAVAYKQRGERERAVALDLDALRRLEGNRTVEALELQATLHNNLAVIQLAQRDLPAAVRHFRDGLHILDALGTQGLPKVIQLVNLGRTLLQQEAWAEAAAELERAHELAEALDHDIALARTRDALAEALRRRGELEDAETLARQAYDSWSPAEAPMMRAAAACTLAHTLTDRGSDQAEAIWLEADSLAGDHVDTHLRVAAGLAEMYEQQERYERACHWHRRQHELERARFDRLRAEQVEELRDRHAHDERERARARELERAWRQAQVASEAKTAFLAVTSHELRTPINAILGYTEMVLDELDEPDLDREAAAEDLDKVMVAARNLVRLIDRILALASLERGADTVEPRYVAIGPWLRDLVAEVHPKSVEHGNTIELVLEGPDTMHTDPDMLAEVVRSLLDNAAQFTRDGSITVKVEGPPLTLHIEDTGQGMDPAMIDKLFQPFEQLDMSYTRQHGGLGIGLALAAHRIRLLGGTLSADATPGEGSRFTITLPD